MKKRQMKSRAATNQTAARNTAEKIRLSLEALLLQVQPHDVEAAVVADWSPLVNTVLSTRSSAAPSAVT
jgi:hypothetical protein